MPCLVRAFYATHCADLSDDGLVALEERIENLVLQGGGRGHHADMAIALALAFFASNNLVGGCVREIKLRNYY